MSLQSHVCKRCGRTFQAHSSAPTAQMGYCSRDCMNGDDSR